MTKNEYDISIFFNYLSLVLQFGLTVCGVIYLYQTFGWFIAGSATAAVFISTIISVRDDALMEQLAYEEYLSQTQNDSEEDQ